MKIPSIYYQLPQPFQNMACSFEGLRRKLFSYDRLTQEYLTQYLERNKWSNEQICEYRDKRLQSLIEYAYQYVPYYTKLFNEGGINPKSIKRLDDLYKIPVLTKDIINKHQKDLISGQLSKEKILTGETGGTTGDAMTILLTQENISEQKAVWLRYYRNLGIDTKQWRAMMTHRMIIAPNKTSRNYWRYDYIGKQMFFSPFHLNEETFMSYYEALKKSKINWIVGFPNRITLFASMMLERKLSLEGQIKYITTGAESLLGYQKNIISKAFGIIPYQHYGMTEGVANFSEDINHVMRVDEDYSCVEFLPEDKHYRIIGTSLNNYVMPLIRYDTKDTANYHIGSNGVRIIDSLDGRTEDYLSLPNGRKITSIGLAFHGTLGIREMQFYQHADHSITMYIVKGIGDFENDVNKVFAYVKNILGDEVKLKTVFTDSIPHTKSGKKRLVISEIK